MILGPSIAALHYIGPCFNSCLYPLSLGRLIFSRSVRVYANVWLIYFWFYSTANCSFHLLLLVVFDKIARPECQIVSQKLHDGRWVTVLFLLQVFQVRDGIIEGGFSKLACQVRWAHNFVVENRVVKGETKTDWVRRLQLLCLLLRELVRILCLINDCLAFILYEELT